MTSGGAGDWRSRGRRDAIPKPVSQTCPVAPLTNTWAGLRILVEQAPPVELAQCGREPDGEAQPLRQCQRAAQEARQRLAPRVREHQHGPPLMLRERQRPHGPGGIELRP